eukprot:TRINITY_DN1524_c0_g2_i6.p1 TRINITY_DN1524_c0_g2~~TRINITY_DN1524_c0_g2_i6.p1  ORF type:complete len:405 (+),score=85.99 TRINITY_DN1524_c0_g2_i6:224-1438(+)
MKISLVLLITAFYLAYANSVPRILRYDVDNDTQKTFPEYILSYGYSFEVHKVPTPDNYILTLWRIPKKIYEPSKRRPPIFFLHGLLDNGFTWLFKDLKLNLPIILADQGYDVWIGNNRGTLHAKEHMNPDEYNWANPFNKFWDFSIDQMASFDVPTMINYICDVTGYEKLDYVGHSQGTAQFFMQAMIDPQFLNEHIKHYVALGAVLFVQNVPGFFERAFNALRIVDLLYMIGWKNIGLLPSLTPLFSLIARWFPNLIEFIVISITGYTERRNIDMSRFPLLFLNEPGGSSVQNMMHWMQLMRNDRPVVKKFDFGDEGNLKHYGKLQVPEYNLKALKELKFPMYLFAGTKDAIVSSKDFEQLVAVLPGDNVRHEYVDDYGHLDYVWADNAHEKLYPKVVQFLRQ